MTKETTSQNDLERFRRNWISRFDEQAKQTTQPPKHDSWEGFAAYRELSDSDYLAMLIPSAEMPDLPFHNFVTEKLAREVGVYRSFQNTIIFDNQCFKDTIDALSAAKQRLAKAKIQNSSVKAGLDAELDRCSSVLKKTLMDIERRRETHWKSVLFADAKERAKWKIEIDEKNRAVPVPPEELTQHELMFENARYPTNLVKRIDLDSRFQIRVAMILRSYLPRPRVSWPTNSRSPETQGVSLRTISRLTVLTYLCAQLGEENVDKLVLVVDDRKITVDAVDQKLRGAGLK